MKLIIGLGNIGNHFAGTRHNVGFFMLNQLAANWAEKPKFKASLAELNIAGKKVLLAKPSTYYNLSGTAVQALKNFYKLTNSDILVIHDELALPFGTVRVRSGGSDAGNNGVKNIIEHIGEDFARLRVGVTNEHTPKQDAADFVLAKFSHAEKEQLMQIAQKTSELVNRFTSDQSLPAQTITI